MPLGEHEHSASVQQVSVWHREMFDAFETRMREERFLVGYISHNLNGGISKNFLSGTVSGFDIGVARVRGYFPFNTVMMQQGFLNEQYFGP